MIRNRLKWSFFSAGLISLAPEQAQAHLVNGDVGAFYAGMLHPVTSAEHLLPMVILALLAGYCGKAAGRLAVLTFPLALVVGIAAGNRFPADAFFHLANLAMIAVMGLLLVKADRFSKPLVPVCCALFTGLILGWRSGGDWAISGLGLQFVPGAALTGFMIIALTASWTPRRSAGNHRMLRWLVGGTFMATGIVMLGHLLLAGGDSASRIVGVPTEEGLKALLNAPELSPAVVFGALLAAAAWGAAHALTPGHGKAIVGAYLVGGRGTPWHALYLGLTVTVTHTLGVFILGLIATLATGRIAPERLYPWLGVLSGLIVFMLGAGMFFKRFKSLRHKKEAHSHGHESHHHAHDNSLGEALHHHHHHEKNHADPFHDPNHAHHHHGGRSHSHLPPGADGSPVTWRSLLALGLSGGLLPCPSALVLLLSAVAMHRIGFGLAMVAAFSIGLAGVLTTVGLLFIKGSRLIDKSPFAASVRWMPTASALVICLIGGGITWRAALDLIGFV